MTKAKGSAQVPGNDVSIHHSLHAFTEQLPSTYRYAFKFKDSHHAHRMKTYAHHTD